MNTLNIAVWTIGEHAQRNILPAINNLDCMTLTGIFTRDIKVLIHQSEKYNCQAYLSSDELLHDPKVKAVYITSPNALHYEQVKLCLLNNKHVIVEKSAFCSLDETQKILILAKNKNLLVMEAFMFLHHQQFHDLKKLITSKKYGQVLFLNANFGFPHLPKNNIRYSKRLAGGALNDAGAYTISATLDILGRDSTLLFSSIKTAKNHEVDTSGVAVIKNENITATCQWAIGGSYKNNIEVWCENAHMIIGRAFSKTASYNTDIKIIQNGNEIEKILSNEDNHFINMLKYFSILIAEKSFHNQLESLLIQSKFLEKIRKSDKTIKNI